MATQETVTVEFTPDELEQTLNALSAWDKHLGEVAGVLPANMPGRQATLSARNKLIAKSYGPGGPRSSQAA